MKLSKIKKDVAASEAGVWVNKVLDDLDVKICSAGNRKYLDCLRQLMKPYQRSYKSMDDSVFLEIQNKAISKFILVDWRNLQDEEGNEIPYSSDKAYEILQDPENEEFRKIVVSLSEESEVFRKEVLEELAGK